MKKPINVLGRKLYYEVFENGNDLYHCDSYLTVFYKLLKNPIKREKWYQFWKPKISYYKEIFEIPFNIECPGSDESKLQLQNKIEKEYINYRLKNENRTNKY